MKHVAVIAILMFMLAPLLAAQETDHITVGAFADYTRLKNANNANMWGLGGRLGVGVHSHAMLEAEMSYDFERQTVVPGQTIGTFNRSGLKLLHGLFGPMFYAGSDHIRGFFTLKGGFLNFSVSSGTPLSTFTGTVSNITTGNTNAVFYPGGGLEFFGGPIGVRVEVGDLMYFNNGANHNLRFNFGPYIRF